MSLRDREKELEPVSFSNGVGGLLQKERKARKLSIKEVSQETAISPRYLIALENDDYSQFPAETYTIGFLNSYADYLNLDKNRLIHLFKQQQIDTKLTPIAELTTSGGLLNIFRVISYYSGNHMQLALLVVVLIFLGLISYNFLNIKSFKLQSFNFDTVAPFCGGERELRVSSLPLLAGAPRNETLSTSPPDAIRISTDGLTLLFCLDKVKTEGMTKPLGFFHLNIDGKSNLNFEVMEGRGYTLSSEIKELRALTKKIVFTPTVLNNFSARIELETVDTQIPVESKDELGLKKTNSLEGVGEANKELKEGTAEESKLPSSETANLPQGREGYPTQKDDIANKNEKIEQPRDEVATRDLNKKEQNNNQGNIQVTLEFVKDSYVEWTKDGQYFRGKVVPAGEVQTFEAQNRLDIKVGNGGGVRVRREGVAPKMAGPLARIVKLEYRRVPDSLDPGLSKIQENISVVQ